MSSAIDPATRIGPIHLVVRDAPGAIAFYRDTIGLALLGDTGGVARMGAGGQDLLVLHARPDAPVAPPRSAGLYHFALLLPSRAHLAQTLAHLIEVRAPLTGSADHLVSEALYLSDPERNGIELYADRPRSTWTGEGGAIRMGSEPLDVADLMAERDPTAAWSGLPAGTTNGHIHLHVSDLDAAERFYAQGLGFERMLRFGPSAAFLAAGGYHHHIGINTWAGVGAPPPPPGAAGLDHFVVRVPDAGALAEVRRRAAAAGFTSTAEGDGVAFTDPSEHRLVVELDPARH